MPAISLDMDLYTLDEDVIETAVSYFMDHAMRKAIRAFLNACLVKIPVRTGFLRGSFSAIKEAFGSRENAQLNAALVALFADEKLFKEREEAKDAKVSSAGKIARQKALEKEIRKAFQKQKAAGKLPKDARFKEYYYSGTGKGATKILKTQRSGIPFATSPDKLMTSDGNTIKFFLDVTISYYRINDFYSRIRSAPWGSMDAGAAAMISSLERSVKAIPGITELLTKYKIVLRGSRLDKTKIKPGDPVGIVKSKFLRISAFE